MLRVALTLFLVCSSGLVRADEPPPAPDRTAETIAVQAWGGRHAECPEWSDGCVVCTQSGCSTPGIACVPRETACRTQ